MGRPPHGITLPYSPKGLRRPLGNPFQGHSLPPEWMAALRDPSNIFKVVMNNVTGRTVLFIFWGKTRLSNWPSFQVKVDFLQGASSSNSRLFSKWPLC